MFGVNWHLSNTTEISIHICACLHANIPNGCCKKVLFTQKSSNSTFQYHNSNNLIGRFVESERGKKAGTSFRCQICSDSRSLFHVFSTLPGQLKIISGIVISEFAERLN